MRYEHQTSLSLLAERERASRRVRLAFGCVALTAMALGLGTHVLRDALGLGADTARIIAGALGLMGVLYAGVLFLWTHPGSGTAD